MNEPASINGVRLEQGQYVTWRDGFIAVSPEAVQDPEWWLLIRATVVREGIYEVHLWAFRDEEEGDMYVTLRIEPHGGLIEVLSRLPELEDLLVGGTVAAVVPSKTPRHSWVVVRSESEGRAAAECARSVLRTLAVTEPDISSSGLLDEPLEVKPTRYRYAVYEMNNTTGKVSNWRIPLVVVPGVKVIYDGCQITPAGADDSDISLEVTEAKFTDEGYTYVRLDGRGGSSFTRVDHEWKVPPRQGKM